VKKSIITILSFALVIFGIVIAFRYLNQGQPDPKLDVITLHEINNTESFLWIDEKLDETVFYISGIEMEKIDSNNNPYFELRFNIKDIENNSCNPDAFDFETLDNRGEFDTAKLKVFYDDLNGHNDIEVRLTVNTELVSEGNYFLDVELLKGEFDFAEINNDINLRLVLAINEKSPALKIWLIVFIIALLSSLVVWFLLLKKMYYPTFSKKGQLNISEPEASTIFLKKNARKLIIGNKLKEKENFFTRFFLGEIQHEFQSSNHSVSIAPYKDWKTKKVLYRLSCKGETISEILNTESYMKHLDKYKLKTNEEVISFEYFNIKHY
jgi:hypothetical protein